MLRNILKCVFNLLDIPDNMYAVFNEWIVKFEANEKHLMMVDVSTMLWTFWKFRSDVVFGNSKVTGLSVPFNMIARWLND